MAFYFALLNVSSKREEKPSTSHPRTRRRRHSIASIESPLLDYRLLPKPQIVGEEQLLGEDAEPSSRHPKSQRKQKKDDRAHKEERLHSEQRMKKSESTGFQNKGKKKDPDRGFLTPNNDCETYKNYATTTPKKQPKQVEKGMQADISSDNLAVNLKGDLTPTDKPSCLLPSTSSTLPLHPSRGRGRGGRPLVVRRRVSPTESTTSESRRSSKASHDSREPRKDSPASSLSSSRRDSDETHSPSFSLLHASLKLSGISISKDKNHQFKKVTFDTEPEPTLQGTSFLGGGSVQTIIDGYTAGQLTPETMSLQSNILGSAIVGISSSEHENNTNSVLERTRPSSIRSCLLRRHSTSDRSRDVLHFRNLGYLSKENSDPETYKESEQLF